MKQLVLLVLTSILSLASLLYIVYLKTELDRKEEQIRVQLSSISDLLIAQQQQQNRMFSRLDGVEATQAAIESAAAGDRELVASKMDSLVELGKSASTKVDQLLENNAPGRKAIELLTVDLGDVGQELSNRMRDIAVRDQEISAEQKNLVSLLKRKQANLNLKVVREDPHRGIYEKKNDEDLSESELETVKKLRVEIDELEKQVGHLVIPRASSFEGADLVREYLVEEYSGSGAVILNSGFHGRGSRIVYSPDDLVVSDITPKLIQELNKLIETEDLLVPQKKKAEKTR